MTQDPQKTSSNQQYQVYDSSFKEWIAQQAGGIVPVLLPGAVYEETVTIELVRPTMRADKAFRIWYQGEEHILHLEFESRYDNQLKSRLLVYNAILYRDHHLPVLTIVLYPFRTTMAKSPLRILSQKKPLLTFVFQKLPLFKLDSEDIVRQHHACMYPLVPTMKNVDANLMDQIMRELVELYHDDEVTLSQQYVLIQLLLERTTTISRIKKEQIKGRLTMFEQLFEESPMIQKMRKQYFTQGKVTGLQELLVNVVRARYPDLEELAQQRTSHFDKADELDMLIQKLVSAPDASTVRRLLESEAEM